jgi:NAD(P)-dependent dehydrogenase (short-subunit alcohol dehydrogenase family)
MKTYETAVVTGGARGIGRAIAELMVRRGYDVVLTDVDGAAARRTADEIGAVVGLAQDVRDEGSHAMVADVASSHGRLTAWFNNAGVGHDGALTELSSEQVNRLVSVNLLGVIWGMRAALAAFDGKGGDIVNIASLSGHGPVPGLSVYAATKAAVVSLTGSVHAETPRNVRVHAVCPDGVDTEMVAGMDPRGQAKALVHSGGGLLTSESVAAEAVALLGSSRVIRTLPGWRGGLVRTTALAPSLTMKGLPVFRAMGRRIISRRG